MGNYVLQESRIMENTVIGVYDSYTQADNALNELLASGFSRDDVRLNSHPSQTDAAAEGAFESPKAAAIPEPVAVGSEPEERDNGVDLFRLISLRDRLVSALDL